MLFLFNAGLWIGDISTNYQMSPFTTQLKSNFYSLVSAWHFLEELQEVENVADTYSWSLRLQVVTKDYCSARRKEVLSSRIIPQLLVRSQSILIFFLFLNGLGTWTKSELENILGEVNFFLSFSFKKWRLPGSQTNGGNNLSS